METTHGTGSELTIRAIRPDDRDRILDAMKYTSSDT